MTPDDTTQRLQSALTLTEARAASLRKRLLLRGALTSGWAMPVMLASIMLAPQSSRMGVPGLLYFLLFVTILPSPATVTKGRALGALEKLTAELRHTLHDVKDPDAQAALWAELVPRLATAHGEAFTAPTLSDAQLRHGAKLAAANALERTLMTISRDVRGPWWEGWERWIGIAVGVTVGLLGVGLVEVLAVPHGRGGGRFIVALFAVQALVSSTRAMGATHLRRAAQRAILETQADTLRAFLSGGSDEVPAGENNAGEGGAARMNRWQQLRAHHEVQMSGWPAWFGGAKGP